MAWNVGKCAIINREGSVSPGALQLNHEAMKHTNKAEYKGIIARTTGTSPTMNMLRIKSALKVLQLLK